MGEKQSTKVIEKWFFNHLGTRYSMFSQSTFEYCKKIHGQLKSMTAKRNLAARGVKNIFFESFLIELGKAEQQQQQRRRRR